MMTILRSMCLYSFDNGAVGYPVKIELLSRHNEIFTNAAHTEPLPIDGEVSSLSAIILDEPYYRLTVNNSFVSNGLRYALTRSVGRIESSCLSESACRKSKAGIMSTPKTFWKHRNDVLKLVATMVPGENTEGESGSD